MFGKSLNLRYILRKKAAIVISRPFEHVRVKVVQLSVFSRQSPFVQVHVIPLLHFFSVDGYFLS